MSRRCAEGRHAFREGACTRKGCGATTTGDLFGAPLDASAGELFVAGEARAAEHGRRPRTPDLRGPLGRDDDIAPDPLPPGGL